MGRHSFKGFFFAMLAFMLLGLATEKGRAEKSAGLFPPNSAVVLLVGLPGDLESETLYASQLASWLEWIASSEVVKKVIVLCDNPESLTLATNKPGKVLKANRANFQGLGKFIEAEPLTLIAWGHGGKQGSTPVLHVQGPRIIPADFRSLAAELHCPQSRWFLLFRGSGRFARELAGEGREIVSSEQDTIFGNDPVAMTSLLKLARGASGKTFSELGDALGQNIAAWYKERNLARTEDPTLWEGTKAPRLLAPANGADSFAAAPAENDHEPAKAPSPDQAETPPAWGEIKRVQGDRFPGADAVLLLRKINYTLGSNPAMTREEEEFTQILTPEGKRFGDYDVSYTPPFEEIEFLDCQVLSPDGKLAGLDPDSIREQRDQSLGDYQADRRKFFSLPGVVPGAVLHVRYHSEWKKLPLPYASFEIPIDSEQPALAVSIQVTVPKESALHFALDHISASDPVVKQTTYGVSYSWRFENVPPNQRESLAPPGGDARLLISTFPDWAAFAGWYERISKGTDEITPEIQAKAAELTKDLKQDRDKILALYNYVTGLRYVAVPLGINSVRPHAASNVLQNQFGDCKDKANLLNALLHSLKLEAQLVLVPRFGQAYENIPGLSFNHAISRIQLQDDVIWVDTTDDVCRFGMLPPGDPGRKVLVIDGKTTSLTSLPRGEPKDHLLKLHGKVDCSDRPEGFPLDLTAQSSGFVDYEFRSAARETRERRGSSPLLAARFQPVAGLFALETQNSSSISDLEHPFAWQAQGTMIGIVSKANKERRMQAPFWVPIEWRTALHKRKQPLFLNSGYPLTLEEEFEFDLPAGAQLSRQPGVQQNDTETLRWRVEWVKVGDGKWVARLHVELARGELSSAQTVNLQAELGRLFSALAESASWSVQ